MGYNTLHSENGIREKSDRERTGNREWTNLIYLFQINKYKEGEETLIMSLTILLTVDPSRRVQSS